MVREIVFDTETTGFNYDKGDRLIEIGAVELINHMPTGKTYHQYINPEREVPEDAVKVHGLTYDMLKEYPTFDKVADEWLDFIGDADLVAHNASFDMKFINFDKKLKIADVEYILPAENTIKQSKNINLLKVELIEILKGLEY